MDASRTTKGVNPHTARVHINAFIGKISASMCTSRTTNAVNPHMARVHRAFSVMSVHGTTKHSSWNCIGT